MLSNKVIIHELYFRAMSLNVRRINYLLYSDMFKFLILSVHQRNTHRLVLQ